MPEAPELEVVKDFLNAHVRGSSVVSARVLKPSVLRSLTGDFAQDVRDRSFGNISRSGKFLTLDLSDDRFLVVNPMLTGGFQFCEPAVRVFKRTCIVMELSNGHELRYLDDRQMGRVYYTGGDQLKSIPQLYELGPDVLSGITFEDFQQRLSPFRGEIKGILTRGRVVSGIGNAYADEILFEARVYPFRKKRDLNEEELRRIHDATGSVIAEATEKVRERMGDDIHRKVRDFLSVHNKGGEACPRCGSNISQITANQRITSYCRSCQPGLLLRR